MLMIKYICILHATRSLRIDELPPPQQVKAWSNCGVSANCQLPSKVGHESCSKSVFNKPPPCDWLSTPTWMLCLPKQLLASTNTRQSLNWSPGSSMIEGDELDYIISDESLLGHAFKFDQFAGAKSTAQMGAKFTPQLVAASRRKGRALLAGNGDEQQIGDATAFKRAGSLLL